MGFSCFNSKVIAERTNHTNIIFISFTSNIYLWFYADSLSIDYISWIAVDAFFKDSVKVRAGGRYLFASLSIKSEIKAIGTFNTDSIFKFIASCISLTSYAKSYRVQCIARETLLTGFCNSIELSTSRWNLLAFP